MFLAIVFKVLCRQFSRSWLSTYITCLNSTWLVYTAFTYCPCVYLKAKSSTTPSANLFLSGANSSLYATYLPPFPFLSLSLSLSHFVFAPTLVRLVSLLADGLIALKDLLPVWFPSFRLVSIKLHCCTGTRVYTRSDLLWPTPPLPTNSPPDLGPASSSLFLYIFVPRIVRADWDRLIRLAPLRHARLFCQKEKNRQKRKKQTLT